MPAIGTSGLMSGERKRNAYAVTRLSSTLQLRANERASVRAAASATGQWPARNPPGVVVKQENAFVMPAEFSPIR